MTDDNTPAATPPAVAEKHTKIVTVRMSPRLHAQLIEQAHAGRMSLNQLCLSRLETHHSAQGGT